MKMTSVLLLNHCWSVGQRRFGILQNTLALLDDYRAFSHLYFDWYDSSRAVVVVVVYY